MRNLTKAFLVLAVVAMLMVGGAASVLAAGPATTAEVSGNITAINTGVTPPTVTITPPKDSPVTVKVTDATIVFIAGIGKATLSDLEVGNRAVATYDKDTMVASRIVASYPLAKHHAYTGKIKSIAAKSFVLTTKKNVDVTIAVGTVTKYKVPGVKDATLANFKVDDKVAVLAAEIKGSNLAIHVVLIPGKPAIEQRDGIIKSYIAASGATNGSITLQNKKGDSSTFIVTSTTKIIYKKGATEVKAGERATVTASRDPATSQYTAKDILVFPAK